MPKASFLTIRKEGSMFRVAPGTDQGVVSAAKRWNSLAESRFSSSYVGEIAWGQVNCTREVAAWEVLDGLGMAVASFSSNRIEYKVVGAKEDLAELKSLMPNDETNFGGLVKKEKLSDEQYPLVAVSGRSGKGDVEGRIWNLTIDSDEAVGWIHRLHQELVEADAIDAPFRDQFAFTAALVALHTRRVWELEYHYMFPVPRVGRVKIEGDLSAQETEAFFSGQPIVTEGYYNAKQFDKKGLCLEIKLRNKGRQSLTMTFSYRGNNGRITDSTLSVSQWG